MRENTLLLIIILVLFFVGVLYLISFYRNPKKLKEKPGVGVFGESIMLPILRTERAVKIGDLLFLFIFSSLFVLTLLALLLNL